MWRVISINARRVEMVSYFLQRLYKRRARGGLKPRSDSTASIRNGGPYADCQ